MSFCKKRGGGEGRGGREGGREGRGLCFFLLKKEEGEKEKVAGRSHKRVMFHSIQKKRRGGVERGRRFPPPPPQKKGGGKEVG